MVGAIALGVGTARDLPGGVDGKATAAGAAEGAEVGRCRARPSHRMRGTAIAFEV